MPLLTCEFDDGTVREWHATADGVEQRTTDDYTPACYVDGPTDALDRLRTRLRTDPKVTSTGFEEWYPSLAARERTSVLRVDLERATEVRALAQEIRHQHEPADVAPGTFRLYNVDLAPQFRYCVETGTRPVPARDLDVLDLAVPETALRDGDITALTADGDSLGDAPGSVLETLNRRLAERDPDVLCCSTAQVIPFCYQQATEHGIDAFQLGRVPGYKQLAGSNTYESYGQVGHSPARYRVPGRATIDRANSFLLNESGIPGLLDLVERSWRPLQETAWGSIGTILTAIQVREALERGILIPWNKWDPEAFKRVETLHTADRGGFTFAPDVGIHEDVVEVDFGSLYPNIMVEYNISPETVCCDCHETADVPGIGYSICDRPGFIPDVLEPIISDRASIKDDLATTEDPDERERLEARSDALKWILVSCFGYQGYRNAKFGRIECHEAINAFAREILLDAKERLEEGGWRVVHGIVDSLWVQPVADSEQTPLPQLVADISDSVDIPLEVENHFEWVCFVPRRDGDAGALTKYFGKVADEDAYKLRGIEARQRSTPRFITSLQRTLIRTINAHRTPEAVARRLARAVSRLEREQVSPAELVITTRVSKAKTEYRQRTQAVAALERAARQDLHRHPGEDVRYVVIDDSRTSAERVALAHESPTTYDTDYYTELALRAAHSIVAPLGWDRSRLERALEGTTAQQLSAFTGDDAV
ncbi:type B DNA-directed DNA polymerase [Salinirussus salinus]|jgi:DNA polymerase I|uniref:type B DNA-directed DNA polymerase n=1 Tax=Salinirussus salinus TaxID=1198300 RepID=UPI001356F08E|nr:type B DNA-directed DNA polymerase [Salinirussus salinus]